MIKVFSRPPDHHVEISGGPTEVLVDWGHRTTLISSPVCITSPSLAVADEPGKRHTQDSHYVRAHAGSFF